ncbi:putative hydrolase C21C3.09c like protein [Verticillium longisporum]|nr:putative hydrolase C21C3.09c like protein [Verticillium longisporum]
MSLLFKRSMATASSLRTAGKVVCVGRNYADHIKELNSAKPKQPFFFLKPTSSILLPGGGAIQRPKGVDMHYEIELAAVVGRQIRDFDPNDEQGALDAIEAYAMSIDLTARNASIPDPHNVEVFLKLNGETKQDASTNLMLFRLPRLLADISKVMTLEKGDIILTGTPAGVGPAGPGDVITGGVRVNGKELVEGKIEYAVEESTSSYEFKET